MTTIERKDLKIDPVFAQMHEIVKNNHKVAEHTKKVLLKNKDVKDFCEEARHFVIMEGKEPLFIHYDVSSWFKKPNGVQVRIESVTIYEDYYNEGLTPNEANEQAYLDAE